MTSGAPTDVNTSISALSYSGFAPGPATMSPTSALSNSSFTSMTLGLNNKNGVAAREAKVSSGYSGLEGESGSGSVLAGLGEMPPQ